MGNNEVILGVGTGTLSITNGLGTPLSIASAGSTMTGVLDMSLNNVTNVNLLSAANVVATTATIATVNVVEVITTPGSDYAEYMLKVNKDDHFSPGDIVGIDCNGKVTSLFADSVHFMVVSSQPSIIGGCVADIDVKMNEKIAFCGRVNVNCPGAPVGSYIVPACDPETGLIIADAVLPLFMSLGQYMSAVGHVIDNAHSMPLVIVKS
jgi:hypothetical protein